MGAALEATDLYRFFHAGGEETLALRGVSLSVEPGEVVAVTGPSGSGKSTLLACLAGLDEPDGGTVRVLGEMLSRRPEEQRSRMRARSIGVLLQSANLLEHLTVVENVRLARHFADRESLVDTDELLGRVGLRSHRNARPSQLSGGEAARAGLAVAVANDPLILLADEPTGELDRGSTERVVQLLRERAADGTAIVVVTHNEVVARWADRVVRLTDGRVVA